VQILKQRPSGSRQFSQCSCSCTRTGSHTWTWTCSSAHCCSWTNCLPFSHWCVPLPLALTPVIRAHLMRSTEAPPSTPRPGDAASASSSGAASPGVIAGSVIGALACKMPQALHGIKSSNAFCFSDDQLLLFIGLRCLFRESHVFIQLLVWCWLASRNELGAACSILNAPETRLCI
jgi:hypothetical protein